MFHSRKRVPTIIVITNFYIQQYGYEVFLLNIIIHFSKIIKIIKKIVFTLFEDFIKIKN